MVDDAAIRSRAIQFVLALRERWVAIPAAELQKYSVAGARIFLTGQQGIFKPADLSYPLSITSTLDSPYTDNPIDGKRVLYDFAPWSREYENDGLKRCAEMKLPLIYFLQTKRKPVPEYIAFAPVLVMAWNDTARQFVVDLTESISSDSPAPLHNRSDWTDAPTAIREAPILEKQYAPTVVQRRLHQARFRNQVLSAYRERCAVCVLRVRPLLDAAHLIPDRDPKPTIVVSEGIALCATHHRAFDTNMMSFDSQYRVVVDLPSEVQVGEGETSMLLAFSGRQLALPSNPDHRPIRAY